MPSYDYLCVCGERFEKSFPMKSFKQKVKCPRCGKMAKKAITCPNAIVRNRYIDVARDRMGDYNPRANRGRGY